MNDKGKSRVFVDFPSSERDLLQMLCDQDFRPPAEQLRYLTVTEAVRRGLLPAAPSKENHELHAQQDVAA